MDVTGKTVLVIGLARSGAAAARALSRRGASVIVNDSKEAPQLSAWLKNLEGLNGVRFSLGVPPDAAAAQADLIVLSPGVPLDQPALHKAQHRSIEVISEIELAFRWCAAPVAAITGTNGKTTTTALTGAVFEAAERTAHVVGNIGVPFVERVADIAAEDQVVAEVSSFQLEAVSAFKPRTAAILNITEDHLNRHKTMERYIGAKARIFENCTAEDTVILNADDPVVSALAAQVRARVLYFSRTKALKEGAWLEDGKIMIGLGDTPTLVCPADRILIPGRHNLENALAAVLIGVVQGVPVTAAAKALQTFPGVAHRIERVAEIDGVLYFNDSKGTNSDAAIKALEAMNSPTVLIAGGMDKHSDFSGFVKAFSGIVTELILLGETAEKIADAARAQGFTRIHRTNTLQEAVLLAQGLAKPGDRVLLSPACASWDMFEDYEARGRVFKEAVLALRR